MIIFWGNRLFFGEKTMIFPRECLMKENFGDEIEWIEVINVWICR
jgi:hypothetical protein